MDKEYVIYTRWLALALRKQGFRIIRTGINEYNPQFDTYVFENSVDLQLAISFLTKRAR